MNPRASLREIARKAGVSVTTARDVRQRIDQGLSPLPDGLANSGRRPERSDNTTAAVEPLPAGARVPPDGRGSDLLQRLRRDPSVRSSERGRALLRLLSVVAIAINACNEFAEAAPIHCSATIAEIARKNARAWQEIAEKFDI